MIERTFYQKDLQEFFYQDLGSLISFLRQEGIEVPISLSSETAGQAIFNAEAVKVLSVLTVGELSQAGNLTPVQEKVLEQHILFYRFLGGLISLTELAEVGVSLPIKFYFNALLHTINERQDADNEHQDAELLAADEEYQALKRLAGAA